MRHPVNRRRVYNIVLHNFEKEDEEEVYCAIDNMIEMKVLYENIEHCCHVVVIIIIIFDNYNEIMM